MPILSRDYFRNSWLSPKAVPTQCCKAKVSNAGFTVVELVAVIALIGVIASLALTRMTDPGAFDAVVARDSVLALSRSAQQSALGRANVQLTLTPSGSNIVVTSIVSGAVSTTRSFPDQRSRNHRRFRWQRHDLRQHQFNHHLKLRFGR